MRLASIFFRTLVEVLAAFAVTAVAFLANAVESSFCVFAFRVGVAVVSLRFALINVKAFQAVTAESRIA